MKLEIARSLGVGSQGFDADFHFARRLAQKGRKGTNNDVQVKV